MPLRAVLETAGIGAAAPSGLSILLSAISQGRLTSGTKVAPTIVLDGSKYSKNCPAGSQVSIQRESPQVPAAGRVLGGLSPLQISNPSNASEKASSYVAHGEQ